MSGIGPVRENVVGAFLSEQSDAARAASDLTDPDFSSYLTRAKARCDEVATIGRFDLDMTAERADFVALAKADNEAGITLGMLDTNA